MNTEALMKAFRFACLPTISVLILLFFGFFSITKTIDFISSNNGWAIAIRVFLVIAEILLIWYMYEHYNKIIIKEDAINGNYNKDIKTSLYNHKEIRQLFSDVNRNSVFYQYNTNDSNIIIIEKQQITD